eukprot:366399-Chlamydomonas_euryale.AAC.23
MQLHALCMLPGPCTHRRLLRLRDGYRRQVRGVRPAAATLRPSSLGCRRSDSASAAPRGVSAEAPSAAAESWLFCQFAVWPHQCPIAAGRGHADADPAALGARRFRHGTRRSDSGRGGGRAAAASGGRNPGSGRHWPGGADAADGVRARGGTGGRNRTAAASPAAATAVLMRAHVRHQ